MGEAPLLALEGVTKDWGERPVLRDVDLQIESGTATGIVGNNGTGKTTLLRVATGIVVADRGAVRFRGAEIETHRVRFQRELGFLSAGDRGLYARLTVRQNLDFWGGLAGMPGRRRRSRIASVLADFHLGELADRRVDRLSMGQRQRVRIAATFLHEPSLVVLDEPETSLDEVGVALLAEALARLLGQGGAVLIASPEPLDLCSGDWWRLDRGRLEPLGQGIPRQASEAQSPVALATTSAARR